MLRRVGSPSPLMVRLLIQWLLLLSTQLFVVTNVSAAPHHKSADKVVLAPGYSTLSFEAPEAGTYRLPLLGQAKDGRVVDDSNLPRRLVELYSDKVVLLSFIYTNCTDVNGCPLASFVLSRVQDELVNENIADQVRLLSISFDRANDSPEVLKQYAENFRNDGVDWQFLTAPTASDLSAILQDYDQFIIVDRDESGRVVGSISHVLRVFLIDQQRGIRNIYSVSFLHPDIIVNDIKTILSQ